MNQQFRLGYSRQPKPQLPVFRFARPEQWLWTLFSRLEIIDLLGISGEYNDQSIPMHRRTYHNIASPGRLEEVVSEFLKVMFFWFSEEIKSWGPTPFSYLKINDSTRASTKVAIHSSNPST